MLVVLVLLATVLMRVALVATIAYWLLPKGSLCPRCQFEMLRIRNRFLAHALPLIERRWCFECGWNGVVRRGGLGARPGPVRASFPRSSAPTS